MPPIPRGPESAGCTLYLSSLVEQSLVERGSKPATIFIIDHDAAVRDALSVTLRSSGFAVSSFSSAGDFLGALPIKPTGCALIEFDLADMTGTELIAQLNARRIALPSIIMSARLRLPVLENPRPEGLIGILQKPFGRNELLRCLKHAFGHS